MASRCSKATNTLTHSLTAGALLLLLLPLPPFLFRLLSLVRPWLTIHCKCRFMMMLSGSFVLVMEIDTSVTNFHLLKTER
uniref:Uncharacterized protein n=1 Tax=Physcomitrium patens TaxID=3218 RepID=A0A7I3ZGI1_PHYPA